MLSELLEILSGWGSLDTWIVVTAALAAMACAVPGVYLVLRRQSMMGDALSHTALPGVVAAFLLTHEAYAGGWISAETYEAWRHAALMAGAIAVGVVTSLLTELVQRLGRVEATAALGVVFTTLFAIGLVLLRAAADRVDLDPGCVLYGTVETVVMEPWGQTAIPRAAVVNGAMLLANLLLVAIFYKELLISAFDPALARAQGISARAVNYTLMAVTAATLVTAFESVGSILVIAMLITPAAAAYLLTDRLGRMLALALVIAAASALLGHAAAITLPALVFPRLGFPTVIDASTAGMIAVAAGALFCLALALGPRHGLFSRAAARFALRLRIAGEDWLGVLYRVHESGGGVSRDEIWQRARQASDCGPLTAWLALAGLRRGGRVVVDGSGVCQLSDAGRTEAEKLVRAHRLWESYMLKNFEIPADHLHEAAARVEHFLGPDLREALAGELDEPVTDPHGQPIPPESVPGGEGSAVQSA